jgi:hypothetical protein
MRPIVIAGSTDTGRTTDGGFALTRWCLGLALMLCCVLGMASAASAAPSTQIVYSTDGGSTWSANATVAAGASFLTRIYTNNDTTGTIGGVSVTKTLPAGFGHVATTTQVCLNPSQGLATLPTVNTSENVCNVTAGQGGPINEAAVWSGQTLTISPTAGVYGQPANLTNGPLAMGKKRYLNLDQCSWFSDPATDAYVQVVGDTPNTGDFTTGTNTSNTNGGTTATCGAGSGAFVLQPTNSGAAPLDLLANRFVNLHDCDYYEASITDSFDSFQPNATNGGGAFAAQTNSSNTADAAVSCGAGLAIYPYQPQNSGVVALDTLLNRYVNIHQCTFTNAGATDHYTQIVPLVPNSGAFGYTTGTNASAIANPSVTCGAGSGVTGYLSDATNSGVQSLDTLDQTRGWSLVFFQETAPSPAATTVYTQNAGTTGGVVTSDTSTITVVRPSPSCVLPALQIRGCWHFDELTGTVAADSSGNGNNGQYINGPLLGQPGVFQTAVQLDGVNDRISVPDSATLDVGDSFSVEGWVRRETTTGTEELFNKGGNGLQLSVLSAPNLNQVVLRKANITTIARSTAGVPADGNFHHVVATRSGPGGVAIYIDGVNGGTTQVSATQVIQDTAFPLQFGLGNSAGARFDEFAIYDRALTAGEVSCRYALASGSPCI